MGGEAFHCARMTRDKAHQIDARLMRLMAERCGVLGGLEKGGERSLMTSKASEGTRIGEQCRHHLRVPGDRLEPRTAGEGAEGRIMHEQLERVGLHELRYGGIAERHIGVAQLTRNITLSRGYGARARPSGRIDATKPV